MQSGPEPRERLTGGVDRHLLAVDALRSEGCEPRRRREAPPARGNVGAAAVGAVHGRGHSDDDGSRPVRRKRRHCDRRRPLGLRALIVRMGRHAGPARTLARLAGAVGAIALMTVPLASGAGGRPSHYADAAGDAGSAPDVTAVTVGEDGAGGVAFGITLATVQDLRPDALAMTFVDADANAATGAEGMDLIVVAEADGASVGRWDGTSFAPVAEPSFLPTLSGGVLRFTLRRAAFGLAGAFRFGVATLRGADLDAVPDDAAAPYPRVVRIHGVLLPAPLLLPKAGKVLSARGIRLRVDSNALVVPQTMTCRLTRGGAALPARRGGCAWLVPERLKGERVVLRVVLGYGGATTTRTERLTVG